MLLNYFKVAIRSLLKNKFYSLINVIGLAIGVACCLLIMIFVLDEISYDRYNVKAERIYRMGFTGMLGGNEFTGAQVGPPVKNALINDFPEVEDVTRFRQRGSFMVRYQTETFKEEDIVFVDGNVFETFSFNLIQGNAATALMEPNSMVITPTIAKKYWGDDDPLGKQVILDNKTEYKITGVMQEIPRNTHFNFDIFLSMESLEESRSDQWMSFNYQTYIVLREESSPEELEGKFKGMIETYIGPQIEEYLNMTLDELEEQGTKLGFFVDPMLDIHLHSKIQGELAPPSDILYVYIFSAIGIFILLIACINFMNLSTARSANRAKEVGIRKVMGSLKRQLVRQFIIESIIVSLTAFFLAVIISLIAMPQFNDLSGKQLVIPFTSPLFFPTIIAAAIIVGFLAGSYPAFYLSAFEPAAILKGSLKIGVKSGWLRSSLVVFQFGTSIILIVGTLIIYNQLNYVQNKKLGFNKEQVLILQDAYALGDQLNSFKEEVKTDPDVINASISGFIPVSNSNRSSTAYFPNGKIDMENTQIIQRWRIDHDYIQTMGMEIILGRNFSKDFPSDSSAILINETAAALFGFGEDAINQKLSQFTEDPNVTDDYRVVGVVNDFHFESLRENIGPMVMHLRSSRGLMSVRINTKNITALVNRIENKWKSLANGQPFSYSFMDDRFDDTYKDEQRIGKIAIVFSSLAIFIACLGLFGLAAFTAEQRTKEIGVRKVMGASVTGIVMLLSKEFGKLIVIAFVIATPLSWYLMDNWLSGFHYRITINPILFLIAGGAAFSIAWLTMGYQSLKASIANPIKSLRDE